MWNPNAVKPAPDSWEVTFNPKVAAKYKGKISQYDDPMSIAEAAVYLKAHQPDLGIENPYELNEEQFEAAVSLLKEQHPFVGEYWSDAAKQISAFTNGDDAVGTTWQYQYFALKEEGQPVAASPASQGFLPKEGATGWSDTWMISSEGEAPQLHVHVDELDHRTEGQRRGRRMLRRGAGAEPGLRRNQEHEFLQPNTTPTNRPSGSGSTTGRRRWPNAATAKATAWTTTNGSRPGPRSKAEPRTRVPWLTTPP